ncbi:amidohydrolase family protein [Macrococcus lamae]|uniref:Amidohydrolase n=1 Tax=Macrococcus lamae TaxID=198484 RepID=A0A4R6BSN7_9STAP|nr:amidohydrolase family protein [Macrococcus lamae]TDM05207.1 amidohydrolase [Macrococcus lamae]
MKSITFEEHFTLEEVNNSWPEIAPDPKGVPFDAMMRALEKTQGFTDDDNLIYHDKRIQFMDEQDVKIQVLSYGNKSPSGLTGQISVDLCRKVNDELHDYITKNPERFLGFATLPINEPEKAAAEFKRTVQDFDFKGALISGHAADGFLDQQKYDILFKTASELDVPIYLHPAIVQSEIYQHYYKSEAYSEETAASFSAFGYGWHVEVGIQAIRLLLSGVFDRYPNLQIIIGHWGEFAPFFFERMDVILSADHLAHPVSHYFKNNFYITPSGMLTKPQFDLVKAEIGIDRILYAADYPYVKPENLGTFLSELGLTQAELEKITYKNAEHLLKLK